jgi:hypothetical protein
MAPSSAWFHHMRGAARNKARSLETTVMLQHSNSDTDFIALLSPLAIAPHVLAELLNAPTVGDCQNK